VDIDTFRGVMTAVIMALFVLLVLWAYGKKRRETFTQLARLPLEDDRVPPPSSERR
jgi:cytochrome c oxidase cbb3-type subunit 4